jgi:hypothetical protein
MRKLILAAVVALAGVGAFAAISLGDEGSARLELLDGGVDRVSAHRVHAPSAAASSSVEASAKRKPKVKYFETADLAVPAEGDLVSTTCPARHKVLSGYFLSSGGIVLDVSVLGGSAREWVFGLLNLTGAPGTAFVGVVCGKKL